MAHYPSRCPWASPRQCVAPRVGGWSTARLLRRSLECEASAAPSAVPSGGVCESLHLLGERLRPAQPPRAAWGRPQRRDASLPPGKRHTPRPPRPHGSMARHITRRWRGTPTATGLRSGSALSPQSERGATLQGTQAGGSPRETRRGYHPVGCLPAHTHGSQYC